LNPPPRARDVFPHSFCISCLILFTMTRLELEDYCKHLEGLCGNLEDFKTRTTYATLYNIQTALQLPENVELRQRWNRAVRIGEKVRIDLLRCKALKVLETFSGDDKAPVVTYAKTLLADHLAETAETGKQRVLKAFGVQPTGERPEDEFDLLERDLVNGSS
jgi:hypothetical protein